MTGRQSRTPVIAVQLDVDGVAEIVSTGTLPGWDRVEDLVLAAHRRYRDVTAGEVADYIPALARADGDLFGICVTEVDGAVHSAGAAAHDFSIQSISKAFVFALVCDVLGHDAVIDRIGVDNTGLAFNSVMALELNAGHPMNPMVNSGALATTALAPGETADDSWAFVLDGLSRFAGRRLELDTEVFASESATNFRNRAIAELLQSYDRIDGDPTQIVDVYTKQCSLLVSCRDLAIMAATLADGGVNPVTGERVVAARVCRDTLSVLASCGLYERSGEWLFEIGVPGKSGVSGGIITVAPGKAGIATFSPRLDDAGNSVRGQLATAFLSRSLGLNLFASEQYGTSSESSSDSVD